MTGRVVDHDDIAIDERLWPSNSKVIRFVTETASAVSADTLMKVRETPGFVLKVLTLLASSFQPSLRKRKIAGNGGLRNDRCIPEVQIPSFIE